MQQQSSAGVASLLTTCNAHKEKYINFQSSLFGDLTLYNLYMWASDKDQCIKVYLTDESYEELQKQKFFK